jgi:hypothetical protein
MADGKTNGSAAPRSRDQDFYAGFTRFEIELEVPSSNVMIPIVTF